MSERDHFDDEEWDLLWRLPAMVASAAALADPGGRFALVRELLSGSAAIQKRATLFPDSPLIQALVADPSEPPEDGGAEVEEIERPEMDPDTPKVTVEYVLAACRRGVEILQRTVAEAEVAAYRSWLTYIAKDVVNSSTTGGFLGFGGERVTEAERDFLAELDDALAGSPTAQ